MSDCEHIPIPPAGDAARRLYDELHALAASFMRHERPDHTLQPTALIHEALLRIGDQAHPDRRLLPQAARAMRRVLVDCARRRNALKRNHGEKALPLSTTVALLSDGSASVVDLLALDEALERLERHDHRHARIVELRYFAGLTVQETADALGVSVSLVEKEWRVAKAWLRAELSPTTAR